MSYTKKENIKMKKQIKKLFSVFMVGIMVVMSCFFVSCIETGKFYSLRQAYEKGLITHEELEIIADYHNNDKRLELTDKKIIKKIKNLYAKELRENDETFSNITSDEIGISSFYGAYGNCYVVILGYGIVLDEYIPVDMEIDGVIFQFGHPVYRDRLVVYQVN